MNSTSASVNYDVIPRAKGWFDLNRQNVVRAGIATALAALARRYAIVPDAKLKDVANLAVLPIFLAYEKIDDEAFKVTGQRYISGAVIVAGLCAVAGATFMEFDNKALLLYGGACGAAILIADSLSLQPNAFLSKI
jgi:hypothetical protein